MQRACKLGGTLTIQGMAYLGAHEVMWCAFGAVRVMLRIMDAFLGLDQGVQTIELNADP